MRKRVIDQGAQAVTPAGQGWLDLRRLALVEITSEDSAHPIESALMPGTTQGWRATQTGKQLIRLLFDEPQRIRRIRVLFREAEQERTQEFVMRWSADSGQSFREIVRQQYNFSPQANVEELEEYDVELEGVTVLETEINPDIRGGRAFASLAELRLA